jgi:hypothetical protein
LLTHPLQQVTGIMKAIGIRLQDGQRMACAKDRQRAVASQLVS